MKEMNNDTAVIMTIVSARGFRNRPTREPIMPMGNRTTIFVPALASTAMNASLAPSLHDSLTLPVSSSFLMIASSTTIEFVTKIPTDIPIAISVDVFSENPMSCMKNRPMRIVSGIVMAMTRVVRRL